MKELVSLRSVTTVFLRPDTPDRLGGPDAAKAYEVLTAAPADHDTVRVAPRAISYPALEAVAGIPTTAVHYEWQGGLPDPRPGVRYLVDDDVAATVTVAGCAITGTGHRDDLVIPISPVTGPKGHILGYRGLGWVAEYGGIKRQRNFPIRDLVRELWPHEPVITWLLMGPEEFQEPWLYVAPAALGLEVPAQARELAEREGLAADDIVVTAASTRAVPERWLGHVQTRDPVLWQRLRAAAEAQGQVAYEAEIAPAAPEEGDTEAALLLTAHTPGGEVLIEMVRLGEPWPWRGGERPRYAPMNLDKVQAAADAALGEGCWRRPDGVGPAGEWLGREGSDGFYACVESAR